MIIIAILFLMMPWLCLIFMMCLIDREVECQAKHREERIES